MGCDLHVPHRLSGDERPPGRSGGYGGALQTLGVLDGFWVGLGGDWGEMMEFVCFQRFLKSRVLHTQGFWFDTFLPLGLQIPFKKVLWGVFRRLSTFLKGIWSPRARFHKTVHYLFLAQDAKPFISLASPSSSAKRASPRFCAKFFSCFRKTLCWTGELTTKYMEIWLLPGKSVIFLGKTAIFPGFGRYFPR